MDTSPPSPDLPLEYGESDHAEPVRSGSNTLRIATGGAIAALVALVGFFAFSQLGSASDGADSPEAAVQALADAINTENLDAAREALAPGERDALADPVSDLLAEFGRVDILSDGIDTTSVPGLDLELIDLSMSPTSIADDLATVRVTGTLRATFFGRELPFGDALIEASGAAELDYQNIPSPPPQPLELTLTTVRQDGSWYVSIAYTIAEIQRVEAGWPVPSPAEALEPQGAASPDAFVDQFVAAAEGLDIATLLAQLNPGEAAAAHRYGSNIVENNASWVSEAGATIAISDLEYRVEQDGDWADVHIERLTMVTTNDDPWMGEVTTTTLSWVDGCMNTLTTYESMDESEMYAPDDGYEQWLPPGMTIEDDGSMTVCPDESQYGGTSLLWGTGGVPDLGLARHEGSWYLSPTRTMANDLLASLRNIEDGGGAALIWSMVMPGSMTAVETTIPGSTTTSDAFPSDTTVPGTVVTAIEGEITASTVPAG